MKNIQIIDGAQNDANFVYQVTAEEFDFIFPDATDVAFARQVWKRQMQLDRTKGFWPSIWERPILKADIKGIQGSVYLHFNHLQDRFPTHRLIERRCGDDELILHATLQRLATWQPGAATGFPMNVQISDAGRATSAAALLVYQMSAADFALLFPAPGQDIEFFEDAAARIKPFSLARFFSRPIPKAQVQGIQGTFFAPGELGRKAFFPTKRESDLADNQGVPPTQRALYAARRGSPGS